MPDGTVSFVVMFHDMDPRVNKANNDTLHWMVWNIPSTVSSLPEGMTAAQLPEGAHQGGIGRGAYGGPCMPPGGRPHHYLFEVYGLDKKLEIGAGGTRAEIDKAMDGHILDYAMMIVHWERPLN